MKTRGAILRTAPSDPPYSESTPLTIEEVHLDPPEAGEVLVEVVTAGLCHSDLSVINGSRPRPLPMLLGHEGAGIVREVGQGVSHVDVGDHVVFTFVPSCGGCVPCLTGRPALCTPGAEANAAGTLLGGGTRLRSGDGSAIRHHLGVSCFAEHAVLASNSVVRVPQHIPFDTAAVFGCAMLTGVGAVTNTASVRPGSSVAVFGLGGVGMAVLLGAVLAGAHPIIAIDSVAEKLDLAARLGASATVLAGPDAEEEVRGHLPGGVDYAFDAVGHVDVLASAFAVTGRGGTTVAVGLPHPDAVVTLPAVTVTAEERRLIGSYMGSAVARRDIPRLIRLHEAGRLPVEHLVAPSIPLSEINQGLDVLASGASVRQLIGLREQGL